MIYKHQLSCYSASLSALRTPSGEALGSISMSRSALHTSSYSIQSDNICSGSALRTSYVAMKRREEEATAVEAVAQEYE